MTITIETWTRGRQSVPPPTGVHRFREFSVPLIALIAGADVPCRSAAQFRSRAYDLDQPQRVVAFGADAYAAVTDRLRDLEIGVGLEEGETPTRAALELAREVLSAFMDAHAVPERAIPDGEGGVSFYAFGPTEVRTRQHTRYGSVIAGADGTLLLVLGDRRKSRPSVIALGGADADVRAAVTKLIAFIGGRGDTPS